MGSDRGDPEGSEAAAAPETGFPNDGTDRDIVSTATQVSTFLPLLEPLLAEAHSFTLKYKLVIYHINKEQDYAKNPSVICDEEGCRPPSQPRSLLEKIETGSTSEQIFETVSLSSHSLFQRAVSLLRTSYLDVASERGFQYSQVTLVKNDVFLNEYKTFYQQKQANNYTQEELQETYGFLLFETENQAKVVCQRGVCIGTSSVSTLGDPARGVYISKYSDYLHPRPWYHGKSGYVVIFNLIKGKIKFVSENYTTNYRRPSLGYDCHVAADINKVSPTTSHFRAFELSQYYLYELSGSAVIKRPRQICPRIIVAFQYREPSKMAAPAPPSILEPNKTVLPSPWKGKLAVHSCVLCDVTLWSARGTVTPARLPPELDFKYVMEVSSLKKRLPEAAFRKQSYLEQRVSCQDLYFDLYEVELSNKQGGKVDKLTDYIQKKQLAIIKRLEDRGFFILLTSSALIPEPGCGAEPPGLHGLHLIHSPVATGVKDWKAEDDISSKVTPVLPALNRALLEAKRSLPGEGTCPNILVKHNFQELYKADRSPSLAVSRDGMKKTAFFGRSAGGFDVAPPPEKCPPQSLAQLKSYFADPSGYTLEVSAALDPGAERPQSPCVSDGICDAGFSLVMTPDPEFLDSEAEIRKETETEKNAEEVVRAKKGAVVPPSNLRVQPKRKASTPPTVRSKRVSLCRPLPKRAAPSPDSGSRSPTTLKLVKGQFPQKRKRGAEVLTAQIIQKTRLERKTQEAPVPKEVPAATSAKRTRRQEKSPVRAAPRARPPVKRSPQKQRVNAVKGNQYPRVRRQPPPAKRETALQLQSEISSDCQKDGVVINTAQPESTSMAHKDLPENSIINCDSQALNMLADLALSAATSSAPSHEPRNLTCSSDGPPSDGLFSNENSLRGTSDHEYHRGVKNQKGVLIPKPSSDRKSNSELDSTVSHEEESLAPWSQTPAKTQSALPEEPRKPSEAGQNSLVAVEHSYALLLAEQSKKHLQPRGLPGPAFAKNGTKFGSEAGTPVGKVMPFRHLQNASPLQKLSEESMTKRKTRSGSSNLKDFFCSHTVIRCGDSFKVTFKCETEYAFNLDSKYTNSPLEKTVVRALHGPWRTSLPDNVEEVKLLLHMWVALFYSNQNRVVRSSRKVVEHSNPAKYVSINSTLESLELSEMEESSSVERSPTAPLSKTRGARRGRAAEAALSGSKCLFPFIKPPTRDLELCVQNEQKEMFARECLPDTPESQNCVYSCNDEVIGGKAKQELSDKLETSPLALSGTGSVQPNGPSVPGEEKAIQLLDGTNAAYGDAVAQATFSTNPDGASSPALMGQKSLFSTLERTADSFDAAAQTKTSAFQDLSQQGRPTNSECQCSSESTDGSAGCVTVSVEPIALTTESRACVPVHGGAERATELSRQVPPPASLGHPVSASEKAQTQDVRDLPSLAVSGPKGTSYLSASSAVRDTRAEERPSLQQDSPPPVSAPPSDKALIMEALSFVKSAACPSPREETKRSQDCCLQTQSVFSVSSEEMIEPAQVEVMSSASATFGNEHPLDLTPPRSATPDEEPGLKHGNKNAKVEPVASLGTVSLQLSEDDSDPDPALTALPPASPRQKAPSGEAERLQQAPASSLKLQDIAQEVAEPAKVALLEKREAGSANFMSVHPMVSGGPLEKKESKSEDLQPVTLILSKENCTLEIAEEINVTSDFPFDSLIEEVSPASSPDPLVPTEETRPSQAVPPCSLELPDMQCEDTNKLSQIRSGDLAIKEKENSFVGPAHPMQQGNCTQVQPVQLSTKTPLIINHSGRRDKLVLPGSAAEDVVPGEHSERFSFSGKVQCSDTELSQPASAARSGSPLQPVGIEDRNLGLSHLVVEPSETSVSPRKIFENTSWGDKVATATAQSGVVDLSIRQEASPESFTKTLGDSDLRAEADRHDQETSVNSASQSGVVDLSLKQEASPESFTKTLGDSVWKADADKHNQVKSVNSASLEGAGVTQAFMHLETPERGFADSTPFTRCSGLGSGAPRCQAQEISVVTMASLLKNSETAAELHEESLDLDPASLRSSSTSSSEGEQNTVPVLQDTLTCGVKGLLNGGFFPVYAGSFQNRADTREGMCEEPSATFLPKSYSSLVRGLSEDVDIASASERCGAEPEAEIPGRDTEVSVSSDMQYEPLSAGSDQESLDDCRNSKLDMENSCTFKGSQTGKKEDTAKNSSNSLMSSSNSDNEAWGYSDRSPGSGTSIPLRNWTIGVKKEDVCVPYYVQIRDLHGILRTYANFTITKEFKDTTRTLHSLRRHPAFPANCGLLSSWTSTWQVAEDPIQNVLDLEYLRFAHKLKQIVKKGKSLQSPSSSNIFPKESPSQIMVGAFPLTKISEAPVLRSVPKSRSPLLVTIVRSDAGQHSQRPRSHTPSSLDSSSSSWKERCSGHSRNVTNSLRNQTVPLHLNKLKYNSTLKDSRNDISLILSEYAEFNKVMLNSHHGVQDKGMNAASASSDMDLSFPGQSASYEDMVTDLCANLHVKLKSVVKEACKSPFHFYFVETDGKSSFLRTKNILRKGGHAETEPQQFCQAFHRKNDRLMVIIRNEDIASHLHQIPSLLKLKQLASVVFAGVDGPEDVLDNTYQELFRTGGFVISDDKIVETLTLVQLKEIVRILEKLNGNGRWKWLLHHRENKKLKEDVRVDSVAHKKNLILKSYQSADIIELLHYHQCDSRTPTKADFLKCLINLQIQHIGARFAVFLTDKPSVSREVFESSGILVTDVNNFIENIQNVAAPFRSSYW